MGCTNQILSVDRIKKVITRFQMGDIFSLSLTVNEYNYLKRSVSPWPFCVPFSLFSLQVEVALLDEASRDL